MREKTEYTQTLTINKKIHNFFPILMKLGENNHLMLYHFHQVLWGLDKNYEFFIYGQFLNVWFFFTQTLHSKIRIRISWAEILPLSSKKHFLENQISQNKSTVILFSKLQKYTQIFCNHFDMFLLKKTSLIKHEIKSGALD